VPDNQQPEDDTQDLPRWARNLIILIIIALPLSLVGMAYARKVSSQPEQPTFLPARVVHLQAGGTLYGCGSDGKIVKVTENLPATDVSISGTSPDSSAPKCIIMLRDIKSANRLVMGVGLIEWTATDSAGQRITRVNSGGFFYVTGPAFYVWHQPDGTDVISDAPPPQPVTTA
jgi:hypothetical protein